MRGIGQFQAAEERALLADKPHRDVPNSERSPVAGHAGRIPPALRRQPGGTIERIRHLRFLVGREQFQPQFESGAAGLPRPRLIRRLGNEAILLGNGEAVGQLGREPHSGAVGRWLGRPVAIGEFHARDLGKRLASPQAVPRFEREPKRKRIVRQAVGIVDRPCAILGPHHLQWTTIERCLAGLGAAVTNHLDGNLLSGLRGGERLAEGVGIGRGGAVQPRDHVADGQPSGLGRRALADDADPAAGGRLLQGKMAQIPGPVILIVVAATGQLDPLDRRAAAGERDQHLRGRIRLERAEHPPEAGRVSRPFADLGGRCSGRLAGVRLGRGGPAAGVRRRCIHSGRRVGRTCLLGLRHRLRPGKEVGLQGLAAEENGEGDQGELDVAAFHKRSFCGVLLRGLAAKQPEGRLLRRV